MFCKLRNLEFQSVDQEDPKEQHFFISRYYSICVIIVNLYLLRLLNIGIHLFQVVKSRVNLCLLACGTLVSYPRPISIYTCKCLHLYMGLVENKTNLVQYELISFCSEASTRCRGSPSYYQGVS